VDNARGRLTNSVLLAWRLNITFVSTTAVIPLTNAIPFCGTIGPMQAVILSPACLCRRLWRRMALIASGKRRLVITASRAVGSERHEPPVRMRGRRRLAGNQRPGQFQHDGLLIGLGCNRSTWPPLLPGRVQSFDADPVDFVSLQYDRSDLHRGTSESVSGDDQFPNPAVISGDGVEMIEARFSCSCPARISAWSPKANFPLPSGFYYR
jgi:hypothetical protein